jgi:hypothetical protein
MAWEDRYHPPAPCEDPPDEPDLEPIDCPRCTYRDKIAVMRWQDGTWICDSCFFADDDPGRYGPEDFAPGGPMEDE